MLGLPLRAALMNQWMAIIVLVITESSDLQNNVLIFALSYYIIILYHSIAPSGESTEGQAESVLNFGTISFAFILKQASH